MNLSSTTYDPIRQICQNCPYPLRKRFRDSLLEFGLTIAKPALIPVSLYITSLIIFHLYSWTHQEFLDSDRVLALLTDNLQKALEWLTVISIFPLILWCLWQDIKERGQKILDKNNQNLFEIPYNSITQKCSYCDNDELIQEFRNILENLDFVARMPTLVCFATYLAIPFLLQIFKFSNPDIPNIVFESLEHFASYIELLGTPCFIVIYNLGRVLQ